MWNNIGLMDYLLIPSGLSELLQLEVYKSPSKCLEMTWGKMNSEDAVNLFLEGKKKPKRCRSKHDEVEESMKDVWKVSWKFHPVSTSTWMTCF